MNVNINTGKALEFVGNYAVPNGIVRTAAAPFSRVNSYPATNGLLVLQLRIGFAWSPKMWGADKITVVRGGFSISSFLEGRHGYQSAPDPESALHASPICGDECGDRHGGIQHGNRLPIGSTFPTGDPFINSTMLTWWNVKPGDCRSVQPYCPTRNCSQHLMVQVGYVGQRTTHLMVPIDLDQGQLHSDGTVTYPYIGGLNPIGTVINGITTTTPTYGPNGLGLVKESASVGNMNYNALQAVVIRN